MTWQYDSSIDRWVSDYTKAPPSPYLERIQRDVDASAMVNPEYYESATWTEDINTPADSKLYCYFTSEPVAGDKTIFDDIIANLIAKPVGKGYWFKRKVTQEQSQTSTWANYVTMTRDDIPYGEYKISWSADIDTDSTNTICEGRVAIDSTPGSKARANIDTVPLAGFDVRTLGDGTHTIEIDFKRAVGNGYAYIRNAKIIIEPVGRFEEVV